MSYDSGDRLCLDGQRLMLDTGTYGEAGSTYFAERNGFDRVTASATLVGSMPASFTVETKDGLVLSYGSSADSRVRTLAVSTNVRAWALKRVADRFGNTMTVTYSPFNAATGESYPIRIDYTANAAAGLTALQSVVFGYSTTRPDQEARRLARQQRRGGSRGGPEALPAHAQFDASLLFVDGTHAASSRVTARRSPRRARRRSPRSACRRDTCQRAPRTPAGTCRPAPRSTAPRSAARG